MKRITASLAVLLVMVLMALSFQSCIVVPVRDRDHRGDHRDDHRGDRHDGDHRGDRDH